MTTRTTNPEPLPLARSSSAEPPPPSWLDSWFTERAFLTTGSQRPTNTECAIRIGPHASLVSVRVRDARDSEGERFVGSTASAYAIVRSTLANSAHPNVVRMWNFIPGIHDLMDGGQARYMAFNEGRFAAFSDWFGGAAGIAANAPSATGVGHQGSDLVVHALAMRHAGESIENPAQVPAYLYSSRWGRLPPCFARATRTHDPDRALLISGTAAVIGEESAHEGDLRAQWDATIDNLGRVLDRADAASDSLACSSVRHVRVYVARQMDTQVVRGWVPTSFPAAREVEVMHADLCRRELLVEVEAVASAHGSRERFVR